MIRFMPDTWRDALLRPVAMAAPDGGVYVETVAPDFRFLFVLLLCVAWMVLRVGRRQPTHITLVLLGFTALAFVPWLATSGNGRYFLPFLFLVGPLAVGMVYHLPVSRGSRFGLAAGMIGMQLFLVQQNEPWNSWGLVRWAEPPAFGVEIPADVKSRPATFVTLGGISYSLIAPRFHPQSRWISLATQPGGPPEGFMGDRTRAFLASAQRPLLLFPSLPGQGIQEKTLPADIVESINLSLGGHGLLLPLTSPCRFLPSAGLTAMGSREEATKPLEPAQRRGFWLCELQKVPVDRQPSLPGASREMEAVFDKMERTCPRLFRAGEASTTLLPTGGRRMYVGSDMRLYVLNDGRVLYKYIRALNAVEVGTTRDVLAPGFRMDCGNIRGRTGLPWEREI